MTSKWFLEKDSFNYKKDDMYLIFLVNMSHGGYYIAKVRPFFVGGVSHKIDVESF